MPTNQVTKEPITASWFLTDGRYQYLTKTQMGIAPRNIFIFKNELGTNFIEYAVAVK